ncbi:eukaryotic translation initiation factor 3 subunit c, partial [Nicotiana attenuata]
MVVTGSSSKRKGLRKLGRRVREGGTLEEEEGSDNEHEEEGPVEATATTTGSRYLAIGDSDSDESNGQKHVVRLAKDKRFDEFSTTFSLQESFDNLNKQLEKVMRVKGSARAPNLYIKALLMLEDFMTHALANKEAKKKISSSNSKSLNSMKQNLKKINKQYEDLINKYRENPPENEDEESEEEEDEDEDELEEDPTKIVAASDEEDDGDEVTFGCQNDDSFVADFLVYNNNNNNNNNNKPSIIPHVASGEGSVDADLTPTWRGRKA